MSSHNILAIPALNDNYIWMIVHPGKKTAVVVDPGEAKPVLQILKEQGLRLAAILITHHHWDHTKGIEEILKEHPVPVFTPLHDHVPLGDNPAEGGDKIEIPEVGLEFDVLATPGHTVGHIAYFGQGWVFTGDTLFTGGCGRVFEGTPDQLYQSLMHLAQLPPETRVYCGHEYTRKNLEFASLVEPYNLKLQERMVHVSATLDKNQPTVPSTIAEELETNPFLRCHIPAVQQAVMAYGGVSLADNTATFAALRRWKDEY